MEPLQRGRIVTGKPTDWNGDAETDEQGPNIALGGPLETGREIIGVEPDE
ncbi:hypothetical protein [Arthrobacter sp. IK3]